VFQDAKAFHFPLVDDWRAHCVVCFKGLLGIMGKKLRTRDALAPLVAKKMDSRQSDGQLANSGYPPISSGKSSRMAVPRGIKAARSKRVSRDGALELFG